MGSEVYVLFLQNKGFSLEALLIVASIGNTLGGLSCYGLARWGGPIIVKKYLKHDQDKLEVWQRKLTGKSEWVALLCWLPFVGEIIATALGFISKKIIWISIYMFIGKFLRYAFLLKVTEYLFTDI
jgi:membrane protein YqaA with SNARE-associated domain